MSRTVLAEVKGFTPIMDNVLKDTDLLSAAVFGRMWRFCQMENGVCQASLDTIADGIGLSRRSVFDHVHLLIEKGYIQDMTPDLRNHPHTYKDTGKASLHMAVSALQDVQGAMQDVQAGYAPRADEDSLKKEVKTLETPKKDLVDGFIELNIKNQDKIREQEIIKEQIERGLGVTPNMARTDWETVVRGIQKREKNGQLLGTYIAWCRRDKFNSPKTAQIANKPMIILDTWTAAFAHRPEEEYSREL
jgi:hypothetical protein